MKLKGLRVIDLSRFLPGPIMTQLMADHGAEVIKIETLQGGEPTRHIGEMRGGTTVYFANTNRNKKSVALNLKDPEGVEILMRLAETADVLVESFRPGVVDRLGVGYAETSARAPGIVYASVSGFGQFGPYRDLAAHDLAIEAMAGVLSLTLSADGKPAIPGLPAADMLAAFAGLSGVLMALLRRQTTGRGDYLDLAMADCLLTGMTNNYGSAMAERKQPDVAAARALGGAALYCLYETKDGGAVALGSQERKFAVALLTALGRPDLIDLCDGPPGQAQEPVKAFLRETFLTKTRDQWAEALKALDFPFAPVRTLPEVLDDDHFRQRRSVITDARGWDHIASPVRYADEPAIDRYDVADLGEHTAEILNTLGYSGSKIDSLAKRSVIAVHT